MNIVNFAESNSLIHHFMAQVRDVNMQNDRMRFRKNIERISYCMAYELSKKLPFVQKEVQTPLAKTTQNVLAEKPVIAFVLRAGMAMHTGFIDAFDEADHCFISAYREEGKPDEIVAHIDYLASPNLTGRTVILVDPMLATAHSLIGAHQAILQKGKPAKLHVACIVAAPEGIKKLQKDCPEIDTLWLAAIDEKLNEHAYIVPGLGDAGDLAFGEKS